MAVHTIGYVSRCSMAGALGVVRLAEERLTKTSALVEW